MKIKVVGSWLVLSLVLSGCPINPGGESNKSGEFALQGCIAAALAVAIIQKLRGEDADTIRRSAFIGCAAGALAGYIVGKRTEEYANENAALEGETRTNIAHTQGLRENNKKIEANIQGYKKEIASIRASKLSQQEKKQQLAETKKTVAQQAAKAKSSLTALNKDIATARKTQRKYNRKWTPVQKKQSNNEIIALERERSVLNQKVNTLTAIGGSL